MEGLKKQSVNINKKDFISILINKTGLSKMQVKIGLDVMLKFFNECFETNCVIEIRGFGKWSCKAGKVKFRPFNALED